MPDLVIPSKTNSSVRQERKSASRPPARKHAIARRLALLADLEDVLSAVPQDAKPLRDDAVARSYELPGVNDNPEGWDIFHLLEQAPPVVAIKLWEPGHFGRVLQRFLVDTNVLLRHAQLGHPLHGVARAAVTRIIAQGDEIVIFPQIIWEFHVVSTRPSSARDGFGWTPREAKLVMDAFRQIFILKTCSERSLFDEWERLVQTYHTCGLPAHDTRLIAAMKVHGIGNLISFNTQDFMRYVPEGINILAPTEVVGFS